MSCSGRYIALTITKTDMTKNILIADDHPVIRKALGFLLRHSFTNIEITEASSCHDIMREMSRSVYSHLILDIVLTDGTVLEILHNIIRLYPGTRIMIFSMQPAGVYQRALHQYGIEHYASKSLMEDRLIPLLGKFLNNEPADREKMASQIPDTPFSLLTAREFEILHYMLKGIGSKKIGDILNIKYNTVSTAKTHIFEKSQTNDISQLLELAARHRIS